MQEARIAAVPADHGEKTDQSIRVYADRHRQLQDAVRIAVDHRKQPIVMSAHLAFGSHVLVGNRVDYLLSFNQPSLLRSVSPPDHLADDLDGLNVAALAQLGRVIGVV